MKIRGVFGLIAAGLAAAAFAGGVGAKSKVHCTVEPFSFGDVPVDVSPRPNGIMAEWTSTRSASASCSGLGVLAIDVWEHAAIVVDPSDPTGNTFSGRAQIVIDFTGAGITVPFKGAVRGVWDDTDIVHVIGARSPGGARVELEQSGTVNFGAQMLEGLQVNGGFFDVFVGDLE